MARRVLDILADVLTLLALTVAAVTHVGLGGYLTGLQMDPQGALWAHQITLVTRPTLLGSGICLGVLAILVTLSLVIHWNLLLRRIWNLSMFAAALGSMLFQVLLITAHSRIPVPPNMLRDHLQGEKLLVIGLVATGFTIFFSLVRMIWTMLPQAAPSSGDRPDPDRRDRSDRELSGRERPDRANRPAPPALPLDPMALETEQLPPEDMQIRPGKEG